MTKLGTAKPAIAKQATLLPVRFLLTSVLLLSTLKVVVIIMGNMGWV